MDVYDDSSDENFYGDDHDSKDLDLLQQEVDWEVEYERYRFFCSLRDLIFNWNCQPPDLLDIFRPEEIDYFLLESVIDTYDDKYYQGKRFIKFVARSSYKDKPNEDKDGKPSLRRTTAVHHAARREFLCVVNNLFKIYNRFDVNYTDEVGLTHFHVASMSGCEDVVEKFLKLGQDANCLGYITGDSPLHLALTWNRQRVAELLLRNGANPNLANAKGLTSLHIMCGRDNHYDLVKMLFEISNEKRQILQVNAQDKSGLTPLQWALRSGNKKVTELLLRNGANPNMPNFEESTPLHSICKECDDKDLVGFIFKIVDEIKQTVKIDAVDKLGRTPLQLAVANLLPNVVDVLLDNNADLSSFVFPTSRYFGERFDSKNYRGHFKLELTSKALIIVEHLEKKGYKVDQSDALTIMTFLTKHGLFEKPLDLEKCYYDNEEFVSKAKEIVITPSLSLRDLTRLQPEEAAKLVTYSDYYKFANSSTLFKLSERHREACTEHLCEKLSRGFFRRWALDSFLKLAHYPLPILCCEMIVEQLMNGDLRRICLATADQS
uniref:PRANC domain-containing protein n=1 Tax=Trichogramma kaykai TaxID=54128 RepID=A0ABD2X9S7_9HYME